MNRTLGWEKGRGTRLLAGIFASNTLGHVKGVRAATSSHSGVHFFFLLRVHVVEGKWICVPSTGSHARMAWCCVYKEGRKEWWRLQSSRLCIFIFLQILEQFEL
jgi:hypothetical protein